MMPNAPLHDAERSRLAALRSYGIMDTEPEAVFDDLTRLAARLCDAPMAVISLVDRHRQWFKSRYGIEVDGSPREQAMCAHAILERDMLVVPDTLEDPRFEDNPFCAGETRLRFYAGAQIVGTEGLPLGMLCVLDREPRPDGLSEAQRLNLQALARQVTKLMELNRAVLSERAQLNESVHRTRNLITVVQAIAMRTLAGADDLNDGAAALMGRLDALGSAQDLLLAEGISGAGLEELLTRQLTPFIDAGDPRLSMQGPDVTLKASAAEAVSMAIYELATNATKHGALSNDKGRITIIWRRGDDGRLTVEWLEQKGEDAPMSPTPRQGFGSAVLGPLTAERVGGDARFELRPEGAYWYASIDPRFVLDTASIS
ncbi:MAG: HWE histidine kinase domain-containing protein [Pseudomonadota bacterium]